MNGTLLKFPSKLEDGKALVETDIKLRSSVSKLLRAEWWMNLYDELKSSVSRKLISGGWRTSGIIDAIKIGSYKLPLLDSFEDIDPMVQGNTEVMVNLATLCHVDLQCWS